MDGHILTTLRAEAADLERKLAAINAVIAAYGGQPLSDSPTATVPPKKSAAATFALGYSVGNAYANSVRDVAREVIQASGELPVPTRVIVEKVKERGIAIRGQNDLNAVSALLSRSDQFISHGRVGWTLKEADQGNGGRASAEIEPPTGDTGDGSETALHALTEGDHRNDDAFRRVAGAATP